MNESSISISESFLLSFSSLIESNSTTIFWLFDGKSSINIEARMVGYWKKNRKKIEKSKIGKKGKTKE